MNAPRKLLHAACEDLFTLVMLGIVMVCIAMMLDAAAHMNDAPKPRVERLHVDHVVKEARAGGHRHRRA